MGKSEINLFAHKNHPGRVVHSPNDFLNSNLQEEVSKTAHLVRDL